MRRRGNLVAFAILSVIGPVATCDAARLPDWAEPIAAGPMPSAPTDSDDSFQVLSTERIMAVRPDGTVVVEDRIAKRALTAGADDVGFGAIELNSSWQLASSRAWHLPPGERARKSRRGSMVELNDTSIFRSDRRTRAVVVPNIVEGSLVFFEFRAEWTPYALSFNHAFATGEPTVLSRLVVSVPAGWSVTADWIGPPGPDPSAEGDTLTWDVADIVPPKPEPMTGDTAADHRLLAVAVVPPTELGPDAPAVFRTWGDVSQWATRLIGRRADPGQLGGGRWTATAGGTIDGIEAAAKTVRDTVRYVAKEVGIDGYRPRPAAETAATLWGDCKDKSVLLAAALADGGVTALPVLVNATLDATVSESVPTLQAFNHMVTAVVLGDLEAPPHLSGAVVGDSPRGRLLVIDPTDERTSPGSLPSAIIGRRALLIDGPQGALITLPGARAEDHRLEQSLTVTLAGDGSVRFARERRMSGEPAARYRNDLRSAGVAWRDAVERVVREQWIGATFESFEVVEEAPDGAAFERISWTLGSLPRGPAGAMLPLFPEIADALPRVGLQRRLQPVVYDFPCVVRSEVDVAGLPAGAAAPDTRTAEGSGWRLETRTAASSNALTASFELRLEERRFDPDSLPDLRRLYTALAATGRDAVEVPASP